MWRGDGEPVSPSVQAVEGVTMNKTHQVWVDRPDGSYEPWRDAEDEILAMEVAAGLPVKKIAFLHDRSEGAIRSRIRKLGPGARKPLPRTTRLLVLERDRYRCRYCYADVSDVRRNLRHVDHVIAVSNGGTDDISNLVTACRRCNCSKGTSPRNPLPIWEDS